MNSTMSRIIFIGIFLISSTGFGSGLRVVTQPQPLTFSTKVLNISCIVNESAYLVKSVISISITRQDEDKPIATLNLKEKLKMAVGNKANLKADGHINVVKPNATYLTLIIDKPDKNDVGTYKCQMVYINDNFDIVEENAMGNVTYQGQDSTDVITQLTRTVSRQAKEIDELHKGMTEKQQQLDTLMAYIQRQNETFQKHELQFQTMVKEIVSIDPKWKYYEADKTFIKAFGVDDRSRQLSWYEARKVCQTFGGDLVQIFDDDKNKFVYNLFERTGKDDNLWIGIYNHAASGYDFKYVNGSDLSDYRPWTRGQPNGYGLSDEKCVLMLKHGPSLWMDYYCTYKEPYTCSVSALDIL